VLGKVKGKRNPSTSTGAQHLFDFGITWEFRVRVPFNKKKEKMQKSVQQLRQT